MRWIIILKCFGILSSRGQWWLLWWPPLLFHPYRYVTFFNFLQWNLLNNNSFCITSHFCLLCPIVVQFYKHHPNSNLFFLTSPLLVHLSINTSALPANTAASTPSLLHLIRAAPSELASPGWRFLDTSFHKLSLSDFFPGLKSFTAALHAQTLYSVPLPSHGVASDFMPFIFLPASFSCPFFSYSSAPSLHK